MATAEHERFDLYSSVLKPNGVRFETFLRIQAVVVAARKVHGTHRFEPFEFRRNIAAEQHYGRDPVTPQYRSPACHAGPLRKSMENHLPGYRIRLHDTREHRIDVGYVFCDAQFAVVPGHPARPRLPLLIHEWMERLDGASEPAIAAGNPAEQLHVCIGRLAVAVESGKQRKWPILRWNVEKVTSPDRDRDVVLKHGWKQNEAVPEAMREQSLQGIKPEGGFSNPPFKRVSWPRNKWWTGMSALR